MELSAALFEQTIRSFKGDGSSVKNQRRSQPRVGIRCRLKIVPVESGVARAEIEVWTRDISRGGIGMISSQSMAVGSRFVVRFPRATDMPALAMVCTIRCCNQLSQGVFAIGAVFEGIDKAGSKAA
jgi:c-di-GMP-binding flagellar brake protein YcgR